MLAMHEDRHVRIRSVSIYLLWLVFLTVVIIISILGVRAWKARNPGAMTVLQAQSMDMSAMQPEAGPAPVATEVVASGPFGAEVAYTGSVAPYQEQVIYPRVEGWLTGLRVYDGDNVSAGQVLAIIDSPDLRTKAAEASAGYTAARRGIPVAQSSITRMREEYEAALADVESATGELIRAEGMVSATRQGVVQAQKAVKSARANVEYWRAEIAREENLLKSGAVSLQEYQSEKAQATVADAELENQEAKLAEAEANVKAVEGDLAGKRAAVRAARRRAAAAKASLTGSRQELEQTKAMASQAGAASATAAIENEYRYIRAPFAGKVTKRYMSPGQLVTPSDAVLSVVQIDRVRLQANVADTDLPSIQLGAPVVARFAKYPDLELSARVTSISPLSNQNSRTATVEAIATNPRHRLVPGDSVTLSITTARSRSAITAPVTAIVQKNGRDAVWVARSGDSEGMPDMPGMEHNQPKNNKADTMKKSAHLVLVTTGATDGRRVEVISGLMAGDEVIYMGNRYLREGDEVFPTEWGTEGPVELPKPKPMDEMPGMPGMKH